MCMPGKAVLGQHISLFAEAILILRERADREKEGWAPAPDLWIAVPQEFLIVSVMK